MNMRRVILESPFAGDRRSNVAYARLCVRDSLNRGEAPLASHLLYTQVLEDDDVDERQLGIDAGHVWMAGAEAVIAYVDRGITKGMILGLERAKSRGLPVELRKIPDYIP